MFRRRFLSFPLVIGAAVHLPFFNEYSVLRAMVLGILIGVVSGRAIFGPPLDEYWKKQQQEDTAAKQTDAISS